jgi:hypothetical protein
MLQHRLARTPVTACHMDGASPLGTDHGVLVVKDEHDRILMTHEAASEHGDEARPWLQRCTDRGLTVTAAFSDDAQRFTAAIKAVVPHARLPADPFPTVKHSWGHLKKSLLSSRRTIKATGEAKTDAKVIAQAKTFWKLRWSLLKKPGNVSGEDKHTSADLAREDTGCVHRFRHILRQWVPIFDHAHSAAHAKRRLTPLSQAIHALADQPLEKMLPCFDDHGEQALRSLRQKGRGKHRRGSNSESGMRLLRRLEKNHDGIRSAATRQHSRQISQAMTSLSLDVADFIEQGPQLVELPGV